MTCFPAVSLAPHPIFNPAVVVVKDSTLEDRIVAYLVGVQQPKLSSTVGREFAMTDPQVRQKLLQMAHDGLINKSPINKGKSKGAMYSPIEAST